MERIGLNKEQLAAVKRSLQVNEYNEMNLPKFLHGIEASTVKFPHEKKQTTRRYAFFTRPQMNMQSNNLTRNPDLKGLISDSGGNIGNYVRCLLDPRLRGIEPSAKSLLLDHTSPWIVPFTNGIKTLTGWPDLETMIHVSKAGRLQNQHSMVDGTSRNFEAKTLTATFKQIETDPITMILKSMIHYVGGVTTENMVPYMDLLMANELDYNTRVYVIVLGNETQKIQHISCTGASIITNAQVGNVYDITEGTPRSDNNDISLTIHYDGVMYDNALIMNDFNRVTAMFNPNARGLLTGGDHSLVEVNPDTDINLRSKVIPLIDEVNGELRWFLDKKYIKG